MKKYMIKMRKSTENDCDRLFGHNDNSNKPLSVFGFGNWITS